MTRIFTPLCTLLCAAIICLASSAHAAKAPAFKDQLMKESKHVITGKVLSVESKVMGQKDIFLIKVKVEFVAKGADIKAGDEVVVVAWQPRKGALPRPPGPQGHDTIPDQGERVTCYLIGSPGKGGGEGSHDAYMPNGITTKDIIEPKG